MGSLSGCFGAIPPFGRVGLCVNRAVDRKRSSLGPAGLIPCPARYAARVCRQAGRLREPRPLPALPGHLPPPGKGLYPRKGGGDGAVACVSFPLAIEFRGARFVFRGRSGGGEGGGEWGVVLVQRHLNIMHVSIARQ